MLIIARRTRFTRTYTSYPFTTLVRAHRAVADHSHLHMVGRDLADGQFAGTAQPHHRALPLELVDPERAGAGQRRAVQMRRVHPDRHRSARPPALLIAGELALADDQPAVARFAAQPAERVLQIGTPVGW